MGISKNTLRISKLIEEHFKGNIPKAIKEKLRELRKNAVLYENSLEELMLIIKSPE